MVQVSYGTFGRSEAGSTDDWMKRIDYSDQSVFYYRRRNVKENNGT